MSITVLAGSDDFRMGKCDRHQFFAGGLQLKAAKGWFRTHLFTSKDIAEVKVIEEDEFRSGYATAGWGLVGMTCDAATGCNLLARGMQGQ